jgi:WD40 repeat protein
VHNHYFLTFIVGLGDLKQTLSSPKHDLAAQASVFHPSSEDIAFVGYSNGVIVQWDLKTGKPAAQFPLHHQVVHSIDISDDGVLLASGSQDSFLRLWNLKTGTAMAKVKFDHEVQAVHFVDDRIYVGVSNEGLAIVNAKSGEKLSKSCKHTGHVFSVSVWKGI